MLLRCGPKQADIEAEVEFEAVEEEGVGEVLLGDPSAGELLAEAPRDRIF